MNRAFSSVLSLLAASAVSLAAAPSAEASPLLESSIMIDGVALRPGVDTDVHLRVFTNADKPCQSGSNTIFAIHGVTHTAATWKPLAQAIFDGDPPGQPVCRIVAIDLPGHGDSPAPQGALYGELSADDYVTAILGSLDRLHSDHQVQPRSIMGHSMGGVLIQMTQQALLDEGTTLRDAFGVEHALMLAPSMPAAVPWGASDNGVAAAFAAIFGVTTPELGAHMSIPADFWATVYFQNLSGNVAPGTPSGAQATALGYVAPESMIAFSQVTGVAPLTRPEVDPGVFAQGLGTDLDIVTCEEDPFVRPEENADLYEYLTGDDSLERLLVLHGPDKVHDAHVADPVGWVAAVTPYVSLP